MVREDKTPGGGPLRSSSSFHIISTGMIHIYRYDTRGQAVVGVVVVLVNEEQLTPDDGEQAMKELQ